MFKSRCALPLVFACSFVGVGSPVMSSPPPPPPEWVWNAGKTLTDASMDDWNKIDALFANDIVVNENGHRVADGKGNWRNLWSKARSHYYGRTLGYSMGWKDFGSLLVFDEYDSANYNAGPPPAGDPRPSTRSILYKFGSDHLIHSVEIANVDAFFMRPKT